MRVTLVALIETPVFFRHKQTHAQDAGQPDTPQQVSATISTKRNNNRLCVLELRWNGGKVRGAVSVSVYSICACECRNYASMPLCEWVHSLTLYVCFCFVKHHTNDRTLAPGQLFTYRRQTISV